MASKIPEIPAIDLLEEGVQLLRQVPGALALYYLGAVPFILGLLFFWADMSHSAYAASHCAALSFLLALLFIWMKCWQSVFALALWRQAGGQAQAWSLSRAVRLLATQAMLQAWGAVLFFPTLILTIPFPWSYAYFQNVTVFGFDEKGGLWAVHRRARVQAGLWFYQNSMLLFDLSGFALIVFLNIVTILVAIPYGAKSLLGLQSAFTQSPWMFLNTTFLATCCALTYLCIDPLAKAAYVLRCFYGESLKTGEAIWAELTRLKKAGALLGLILLLVLPAGRVAASPLAEATLPHAAAAQPAQAVAPAELDRAIRETLHNPRYAWRTPRELAAHEEEASKPFPLRALDSFVNWLGKCVEGFFKWIGTHLDSRTRASRPASPGSSAPTDYSALGAALAALTKTLVYVLLAVLIVTVAILIWRTVQRNRQRVLQPRPEPAAQPAVPDLNDEQTAADQLPTDSWLLLAQQMIERGELRLALRALYLASLAALAQASLIRIRRSKSNLDYVRELRRRAHAWPGLLDLFSGNVLAFDRAWYGFHEVTREAVEEFKANYERIRALVG